MRHFAITEFWQAYRQLPKPVRAFADKNFALLKTNPNHPSLRLERVGALVGESWVELSSIGDRR